MTEAAHAGKLSVAIEDLFGSRKGRFAAHFYSQSLSFETNLSQPGVLGS